MLRLARWEGTAPWADLPLFISQALNALSELVTAGDTVGPFEGRVTVGIGLDDNSNAANHFPPLHFSTYSFRVGDQILIASWLDHSGIEFGGADQRGIEVEGLRGSQSYTAELVHYVTGTRTTIAEGKRLTEGTLRLDVPRTEEPVLYLYIEPADR